MKKGIILGVLVILAISSVFAGGGSLFSFEVMPQVPLYREPMADPYAYNSYLRVMVALDESQKPYKVNSIVVEHDPSDTTGTNDKAFYALIPYSADAAEAENKSYINMKTAISLGLFRVRFNGKDWIPSADLEVNIAGYINTIFNMFGKNDTLDFDGSYLLGASLRVADRVTFRFGLHHFSGHYGDEMLEKYYTYNEVNFQKRYNSGSLFNYAKTSSDADSSKEYYLNGPVEYVRDNSWIFAVSADIPFGFRIYGEAELPKNPSWLRPFIHVPADYDNPVAGDTSNPTLIDRIGGTSGDGEHVPQSQLDEEQNLKRTSNGSYKAWRIHTGVEWRLNVGFGAIFLAADFQFHQDGQTLHTIGGYNKENPWEYEITAGGGLELGNFLVDGRTVRIEAYYHNGRVPATQWFYQRISSVTVGLGVN